jgi:cellulose synthase/poly-beta-1,6-N-acetylglucosamine synthase-like glycosyltransferase
MPSDAGASATLNPLDAPWVEATRDEDAVDPIDRPVLRVLDAEVAAGHLQRALARAEDANPGLTATGRLSRRARLGVVAALVVVGVAAVIWPAPVLGGLTTLCTVVYLVTIANRVQLVRIALRNDPSITVTDAEARAVADHDLPHYTVLVPAYGEPAVVPGLLAALGRLEYPRDRLDVKLLLEADDLPTIRAAMEATTDLPVEVLLVPPGEPRTKPRALNFGMELARGELVTIYDAEDHPDPLQLRRAVVAFTRVGDRFACLQARLSFYGGHRNLLTRWFTNDYFTWFRLYLPGLSATGAPIPLGGTSNHFRRELLEEVGCWDPWNVTEDADLGIRLQRRGYRVGVLDSVTMEEPNIDVINWVKQRSRWYKGYLQTFLVALRRPRELVADLGWRDTARLGLFVGGTPALAVLNLWFWSMTLFWFLTRAEVIDALFPGWTYYMAVGAWAVGNLTILYIGLVSLRVAGRPEYLLSAMLVPLYWLLMSVAALRAAIQLVTDPSHWEKTEHGLFDPEATPELRRDT